MSTVNIDSLMDYLQEHMEKSEEVMKRDFASIRTGKASPALLDNIKVDYYGTMTRLKDMSAITAPEPRLLVIQPWDQTAVAAIEKAIIDSDLGISPVSDGKVLRLPIPELSEERRKTLVKQVKTRSEDAKIAVRNIRREGNDIAKKAEKASEITEDDLKDMLTDIQKMTDDAIKVIEQVVSEKEADLMSL
ncbi:ribosome recycling factor [Lentisphaerota bacterium WC36G]|nr:ribosome recycling factor [Lentisphaerae bacterium WC36]